MKDKFKEYEWTLECVKSFAHVRCFISWMPLDNQTYCRWTWT